MPSRRWNRILPRLRRDGLLPGDVSSRIGFGFLAASQRISRYNALLDQLRPSAVLVEYDRNIRGACLVLAARSRGVPAVTLVHGTINGPYGFTPVLADRVLCWGEIQEKQLCDFGVPRRKIRIVGFERLEAGPVDSGLLFRKHLQIGDEETVALLATNPIEPTQRLQLAMAFCKGVSEAPGFRGVVRLHPSETLTDYDSVRKEYPSVLWTSNTAHTLEQAFALSDVVVVHSSGFGAEALVKGRICIVLDVLKSPLGNGAVLVREAGAPKVDSAEELSAVLRRIDSDSSFLAELKRMGEAYSHRIFAALGADACENIAEEVMRFARSPSDSKNMPRSGEAGA